MKGSCFCLGVCAALLGTSVCAGDVLPSLSPSPGYALENGDVNGDWDRDVSDGIHLLSFLFTGGSEPVPLALCAGADPAVRNGDSNGDGARDVSDAIRYLGWLFLGSAGPTQPCGDGVGADRNVNPRVLPPGSKAHGMTYGDWGGEWWKWSLAVPQPSSPIVGGGCDVNQSGPVWFLAGSGGGGLTERSCTIPAGKTIFFPLIDIVNDYPCPDPTFEPAQGQSLEDFLAETANFIIDHVTELEVQVDGVDLGNLFNYRGTSSLFTFTADLSWQASDPCVTGTPQQGVSDGYWILLAPLAAGSHTLYFRAKWDIPEWAWVFEVEVAYDLTILP